MECAYLRDRHHMNLNELVKSMYTYNSLAGVYWCQCIILTENYRSHRKLYWIQTLSPWGSAMTTQWNSDGRNVYQFTFWNCDILNVCHSIIKVPTALHVLLLQASVNWFFNDERRICRRKKYVRIFWQSYKYYPGVYR